MQARRLVAIIVLLGIAAALPVAGLCKGFKTVNGVPCFEAKPGKFYKLYRGVAPTLAAPKAHASVKFGGRSKGLAAVDLGSLMPPVGDCGNQNSAAAWATTYYYKSFQEAKEHAWSVSTAAHQYSPAWTYNQTNAGADTGSTLPDSLQLLVDKGATTLADQPYADTDYSSWPTLTQYKNAMPARAQSFTNIFRGYGKAAAQLQAMKDILASGDAFVLSIAMFADFGVASPNYLYDHPSALTYVGQLPLVIVGYDDTVGGVGGFKFRNCWGTDWGNAGSGYLSYDFISSYGYEAYTMADRTGYQPQVWSRLTIQHPRRMDLTITIGHGDTLAPDWSNVVYANEGGYGQNVDCYVDVTDYPHVDGVWWVKLADQYSGSTGVLTRFSLIKDTAEMASTEVPLAIPDMSSTIARLRWVLDSFTLQVTTGPGSAPLAADNHVTVKYTRYGVPGSVDLWNGKQATVEADAGVPPQFADVSSNSDADVRWKLAPTIPVGVGVKGASKAQTVIRAYYQQYRKLFSTRTLTGPVLDASNYATLTYKNCGLAATMNVWDEMAPDATVWADRDSHYSYGTLSKRSSATERWTAYAAPVGPAFPAPGPLAVADNTPVVNDYWHQYRPLVTFAGADSTHLVSLLERSLCGQQVLGTPRAAKWNDWADDGSTLSVSPTTSGTPIRKTFDTTSWTVADSFTATVKYRAYFTIAGKITTKDDTPVAGVQVKVGALEFITADDGLFRFEDLDAGSYTIIPSKVGAAFAPSQLTVTVDGRHGDSLSNNFVLTTVPTVLSWLPLGGAVAPTAPVTILFSEPMNPASVASALILQETFPGSTSVGPIVTGTSVWTDDNCKLIFTPSTRLKAYRNYRVTVGALAESAAGGPLGADFQWTFQTKDCLAVVAYSPMAGSNPPCSAPIVIDFDRDVALATARACFSIAPQVEGRLSLLTPRKLQFQPSVPLPNTSTFTVTLTGDMRGLDQVKLLKPFNWSFTTEGPAQVLGATPVGTAVPLSGGVVVTFDRPMKRDVTAPAFSLTALGATAPVVGAIRWNSAGTVLTFVPAQWLRGATQYAIRVAQSATSAQGAPLGADFLSTFTTANTLQVQSATPSGAGLAINSVLRLSFDRPVNTSTFALTLLPAGEGATPVDGTAYWTDNRNVTFTPRYSLAPATLYTATIANTLTAGDGTTLGMPYAWSFTTHGLTRVLAYGPRGAGLKPGAAVTIRFDRPMDQLSVAANFQVFQIGDTAEPLAGQITWNASATQLTFTPATRLASFTDYRVTLSRNALSADNLAMASNLEWMFQTAHAVQVVSFAPTGNLADPGAVVTLQFDQLMRRSTVQEAFSIQPAVAGTFAWSDGYHLRFRPSVALTPGQTYTVTVGAGARALDGLGLLSAFQFTFTVSSTGAVGSAPLSVTAAQAAGGNVAISFSLASAAQVQVQVFNVAGRPIASLSPAGLSAAGANVILWNGKSATGSHAPAGLYLVQVVAKGAGGSQSSSLAPLQLR